MRILTADNQPMDIDYIPEHTNEIRYCVLDYSDKNDPDYFWVPLVFIEIFTAPAAVIKFSNRHRESLLTIPLDWHIVICDPEHGEPEIIPVSATSGRGFSALSYNPLSSFRPEYIGFDIVGIIPQVTWHMPSLKSGHFLTIPDDKPDSPRCFYFVNEFNKVPDQLSIHRIIH